MTDRSRLYRRRTGPESLCPCSLFKRPHRRSAHEKVDLGATIRAYIRHIPVEVHAEAIEALYQDGQSKQARRLQKLSEGIK